MRIIILATITVLANLPAAMGQSGQPHFFDPAAVFRTSSELPAKPLAVPGLFQARGADATVVRGQSTFETPPITPPSYDYSAPGNPAPGYSPGYAAPGTAPGYGGELRDPFLYGDPVIGAPQGSTILSGVNGPQPYRFGFTPRMDYTLLAPAGVQAPGNGNFMSNEFNFELAHVQSVGPGWVFTNTPQVGLRLWDGPQTPDLPGSVYRLGWDFTLAAPIVGLWSLQVDFNPSINTDFNSSLASESLNLDGNAMLFYRASPQWMFVLGAGYWDRVDNIILPYAGAVWNPNDRWELRMLFPKSRVSYFLGNFGPAAHWLYASGEYHVESYQIHQPSVAGHQQVQIQDWRLALGLRSEHATYDKFIEIGYVFGRNVEFLNATPGFDINDTFMLRAGVKF